MMPYPLLTQLTPNQTIVFALLMIWSAIWKGIALWKAGRNNHRTWFIILFLVNTLGLLEILYIGVFQKGCCRKEATIPKAVKRKKKRK